jgi:Glycosyl hydrolases family 16
LLDVLRRAPRKDKDFLAHRHAPDRRLSRRSLLGWSGAATFAAATGLVTAWTAGDENASRGRVLFRDAFAGHSLSRNHWNPYICDNSSNGWPWLMQPSVAVASSAIGHKNGFNAAYDLPSAIRVDDGLTLRAYRGTKAAGYSWTGSVICSRPTSNNFGSGTVHTAGLTFADARVEVRAKMPDMTRGQWPAIWFLPAAGDHGAEIDMFEGGYLSKTPNPNQLMAVDLFSSGNRQQLVDCRTDLSAGYHTYSMEYRQGRSIKFFFDGSNVYTYTRNVPVGHYYIILSNSIASAHAAGWHTQVSRSTPAVNLMQVSYVRVLAL